MQIDPAVIELRNDTELKYLCLENCKTRGRKCVRLNFPYKFSKHFFALINSWQVKLEISLHVLYWRV
jgi:hypothetical protein